MFLLYFGQTNAALVWHILKHYKIVIIPNFNRQSG